MITQFNRDQHVNNLPGAYNKGRNSNNAKILDIEKHAVDGLRDTLAAIYETLDLDKARGKTLDLYGEMIGQQRGVATDEQYLILIKNRLARRFTNADYNSVAKAIASTFGCDPSEIVLTELDAPCKVTLEGLPVSLLNANNIDIHTAVQIVTSLLPVSVFMEAMSFSGTFEFGSTELEYDESAGFGNEEQTIGGYLGLVSDSAGSNLPV